MTKKSLTRRRSVPGIGLARKIGYVALGLVLSLTTATAWGAWNTHVSSGTPLTAVIWNDLVDQVTSIGSDVAGLGTAATKNVGVGVGNVIQLDANAKLPAVDGSQLTGIATSDTKWDGGATGLIAATGRTSLGLGSLATQSGVGNSDIADGVITFNKLATNNCAEGQVPKLNASNQWVCGNAVQPGYTTTCTAGEEGQMRYDSVNKKYEGCDGDAWRLVKSILPDTVAPTTSGAITAGTLGSNSWYTTDVTFTLTPADDLSGVASTVYCTDTTNACTPGTSGTSVTVSTESATNYVRWRSTDVAGNVQTIQSSGAIKIDKAAPTGGSVTHFDGEQASTSVAVMVARGSDTPAGLSATDSDYLLEYKSAAFSAGSCGSYSAWTDASVSETAGATSYNLTVTAAYCYAFRYTVKDVAGNTVIYASANTTKITPSFVCGTDTIADASSNTYQTVSIGGQCWMKSNLRTTKKPDGTDLTKGPVAHGGGGWTTDAGLYSCPPNATNNGEDCSVVSTYGMTYQWSAAMNGSTVAGARGICPAGWHVPTDAEYITMEEFLGMCSGAGAGCSGATGWRGTDEGSKLSSLTLNGNNSSGFTGILTGYRSTDSNYFNRGAYSYIWSSSESGSSAWRRSLGSGYSTVLRNTYGKAYGFSVRCLRD